jgi:5-methylcytosine-specific restriction endonuclease McrA
MPLKRGGSQGLENLEFPCPTCNRIKGGLTPDEMIGYTLWKTLLPREAQDDLDDRLSKAVQALTSMGRFQRRKKANA